MTSIRTLIFVFCLSAPLVASTWTMRLGIASFPGEDALLGLEVTNTHALGESLELGLGGVFRTNFSDSLNPGLVGRLRYWLDEHFSTGVSSELGYLYVKSFNDLRSYGYFIIGPTFGARFVPLSIQWEPGFLFYQGTTKFVPLRLAAGFVF